MRFQEPEEDRFEVYRENRSVEPVFGFYVGLNPQCIDGQEFIEHNPGAEKIFTKKGCKEADTKWKGEVLLENY